MQSLQNLNLIREVLKTSHKIAVVGFSPKQGRPSNMVGRYLIEAGYKVFPVNPGQDQICQLLCYRNLDEISEAVDIVVIFRRSDVVFPVVEGAVKIGAKVVWMQQGIVNVEAARYAENAGLLVVMDRCIKVDHQQML